MTVVKSQFNQGTHFTLSFIAEGSLKELQDISSRL